MRIIVVDDEQLALDSLAYELRTMPELGSIALFRFPGQALEWLAENQADVAFLDINMCGTDGLTMAKRLRELQPDCAVVFVTGYSQYALEAFRVHARGYLLKPASREDIRQELQNLTKPYPSTRSGLGRLKVQCFGSFEVFHGADTVKFRYRKTKELFAYLVSRHGAAVALPELRAVLWGDRPDSLSLRSQLRNSVADLTRCLAGLDMAGVLHKYRNSLAVEPTQLDCDYYSFLRADPCAVNAYTGEYMSQYSWAEMTLGAPERASEA